MKPVVLKFGGTSMGSADAMQRTLAIITRPRKERVAAVVVSAMSGVTNALIEIAKKAAAGGDYARGVEALRKQHVDVVRALISERNRADSIETVSNLINYLEDVVTGVRRVLSLSPDALDHIMSYGERLSAHILADALQDRGVPAEYLNARKVVVTDAHFGSASVDFKATNTAIRAHFSRHKKLQVVTGFIGATKDKKTTTLGRGGSDYSGAIFGAALDARAIEIWTDVSGVFTADPRKVKGARVVAELAFEEAGELAYFGAKVLHPKTILPAMEKNIPVKVLNTFKPHERGTRIVSSFKDRRTKSKTVEALTFKKPVTIVHVNSPEFFDANGLMARIFNTFAAHRTSVDVVSTSVAGVSLTTDNDAHLEQITAELQRLGTVTVERGKAILCAVGGSVNAAGVAGKMFSILGRHKIPVEMISQAASGVSITFVVNEADAEKALQLLHKAYIRR